MATINFKIRGNAPPFTTQLLQGVSIVGSGSVATSGTTTSFIATGGNTYKIKVTDGIGQTINSSDIVVPLPATMPTTPAPTTSAPATYSSSIDGSGVRYFNSTNVLLNLTINSYVGTPTYYYKGNIGGVDSNTRTLTLMGGGTTTSNTSLTFSGGVSVSVGQTITLYDSLNGSVFNIIGTYTVVSTATTTAAPTTTTTTTVNPAAKTISFGSAVADNQTTVAATWHCPITISPPLIGTEFIIIQVNSTSSLAWNGSNNTHSIRAASDIFDGLSLLVSSSATISPASPGGTTAFDNHSNALIITASNQNNIMAHAETMRNAADPDGTGGIYRSALISFNISGSSITPIVGINTFEVTTTCLTNI